MQGLSIDRRSPQPTDELIQQGVNFLIIYQAESINVAAWKRIVSSIAPTGHFAVRTILPVMAASLLTDR